MNNENKIASMEGLMKEMSEALTELRTTTHNKAANTVIADLSSGNKLVALEGLVNEMTTALAELVEAVQGSGTSATEISTTLVEMLGVMQSPASDKSDFKVIAEAIGTMRLQVDAVPVSVNVQPAPVDNHITVQPAAIQILPGERGLVDYDMTVDYDQFSRITKACLTAHPRKK